jgi:hypothetical protein
MIPGINYYLSISDAPYHLIPPHPNSIRWFVVDCKRTKLEKLYRNKSFECCCFAGLAPVIIYYYWREKSYHIFLPLCAILRRKFCCRIFHVNVPLIEIYDILTLVLYIFIIFYDDDIFFITYTQILSFIFALEVSVHWLNSREYSSGWENSLNVFC